MASTNITSIQFKRGNKSVLASILKGDKKPLKGEPIWEIDTNQLKIGDGINNYADLPYMTDEASDIVVKGYYDLNVFWDKAAEPRTQLPRSMKCLYVDIPTNSIYYYSQDGQYHKLLGIAQVDSNLPGLVKLYSTTGQNEDGTMTQKAITAGLNKKAEISLSETETECIIIQI